MYKFRSTIELKVIAAELLVQVRKSVTIDWNLRESSQAKIRAMVRRILRKYGYPPGSAGGGDKDGVGAGGGAL